MAKKPGRGQKQCPECGQVMAAARKACEKCGYMFTKSTALGELSIDSLLSSAPTSEQIATVLAAQELLRKCGGINEAMLVLEAVDRVTR